jgi:hypothetical protein
MGSAWKRFGGRGLTYAVVISNQFVQFPLFKDLVGPVEKENHKKEHHVPQPRLECNMSSLLILASAHTGLITGRKIVGVRFQEVRQGRYLGESLTRCRSTCPAAVFGGI